MKINSKSDSDNPKKILKKKIIKRRIDKKFWKIPWKSNELPKTVKVLFEIWLANIDELIWIFLTISFKNGNYYFFLKNIM